MIEFELMNKNNIDEIYQIESECFQTPWPRSAFFDELKNPHAIYILARLNGQAAGFAGMWHIINEGHITNLAVAENFRRRGVGDGLVKELIRIAKSMDMIGLTLEVRIGNIPGQKLYFGNGFTAEGIRKNYYTDTKEDAIVMWKYF
ncbi:MAG: ribosomal protein S18-alanine N-acetyltransferase [Defluviitaleaceae bacterium]|nr:ribosomal protein S18-alanine N-acetyltransferase [Defluviitaleaceae bacterium]